LTRRARSAVWLGRSASAWLSTSATETADVSSHYPNRLRQLRGLSHTQEEIAEKVGVAPSTYRAWEEGAHRPRPYNVRALLALFSVREGELGFDQRAARSGGRGE